MGGVDMWHVGGERKSNLSSLDWNSLETLGGSSSGEAGNDAAQDHGSLCDQGHDLNGFSSSLPALLHEKLNFGSSLGELEDPNVDGADADDAMGPLDEEMVSRAIGDILPKEEELYSGMAEGLDGMNFTGPAEENDDFDLFSSGGGLELDGEPQAKFSVYMNSSGGLDGFYGGGPNVHGPGSVVGEHPFGEHPSRTLFVRNINSNVEDSELSTLFEHYGDIRTLYTACKNRGFVMISFYDIRAARNAMRSLQNKPLRRRKLDIHFSIPKDNPSDKDINQGTLVVFNLDASVSNDDLRQIFGRYGEVKEIRETPHKHHHKFVEFYDVRAAEAALRALNRSDIAGKRIKLEPSRPGGTRRSLMHQISLEPAEQDDGHLYCQQSSLSMSSSPSGHLSSWGDFISPMENSRPGPLHHAIGTSVPNMTENLPGSPVSPPNHVRVGTIGSHLGRSSYMEGGLSSVPSGLGLQGLPSHHAHSLPEYSNSGRPFYSPETHMLLRSGVSYGPHDGEGTRISRSGGSDISLFENAPASGMLGSDGSLCQLNSASVTSAALSGPQFLWGNSSPYRHNNVPVHRERSNPFRVNHNLNSAGHVPWQPLEYGGNPLRSGNNSGLPFQRYHVGSAPSGDPSFLERQFTYVRESPETTFYNPSPSSGGTNLLPRRTGSGMMNMVGANLGGSLVECGGSSPSLGVMSPHGRGPMFPPPSSMIVGGHGYFDMMLGVDRGWIRRSGSNASQAENKKHYQLDIERILGGEDHRTTLMIKNIPNKYTQKMLLAAIDENHGGMYDFLYLPIDFKNKCNVGYAFINMNSTNHIISLYQAFNGKKWEKFNSEKVASLAYARIQGRAALVAHFQNSSLMNEDKRCRPILFNSEEPKAPEPSRWGLHSDSTYRIDPLSQTGSVDVPGIVGSSSGEGSSSLAKEG